LPDYEFLHTPAAKRVGGAEIYISNKLNFEITEEFQIECEDSENIWMKLQTKNNQKYVIGVVYCHPTSSDVVLKTGLGLKTIFLRSWPKRSWSWTVLRIWKIAVLRPFLDLKDLTILILDEAKFQFLRS